METLSQYLYDEIARYVVYASGTDAIMLSQTCKTWYNTIKHIATGNLHSNIINILASRSVSWLCREKKFYILANFCNPEEVLHTQMNKLLNGSNSYDVRLACMATAKIGGPEKAVCVLKRLGMEFENVSYVIAKNKTPTKLTTIFYQAKDEDAALITAAEYLDTFPKPRSDEISRDDFTIALRRVINLGWLSALDWLMHMRRDFDWWSWGYTLSTLKAIVRKARTVECFDKAAMAMDLHHWISVGSGPSEIGRFTAYWRCKRGFDPITKLPGDSFAQCAAYLWKEIPDPLVFFTICTDIYYQALRSMVMYASHYDNQDLIDSLVRKMPLYVRAGVVAEKDLIYLYSYIHTRARSSGMIALLPGSWVCGKV